VLRTTIRADENTDVEQAVGQLRAQCESAGVAGPHIALVAAQTREILGSLVTRGKQLASQGSQLSVTRDLTGDEYAIRLIFGAGLHRSFWQRLLEAVRGS
jgi:hypothetical protein